MIRVATYLLTIALSFGAGAAVSNRVSSVDGNTAAIQAQAGNAAFRDGLYLGKLTASQGKDAHISEGRWSQPADRASFVRGYQQGYRSQL